MHENREISRAPWSVDQGRSAKAISRTADVYVPEKSDYAVLPVNQPNKEGQLSAEAGEGRAQTRENIVQSHMHPTPSGKGMSQGLDGMRKVATERKQERFTALLHHLNVTPLPAEWRRELENLAQEYTTANAEEIEAKFAVVIHAIATASTD